MKSTLLIAFAAIILSVFAGTAFAQTPLVVSTVPAQNELNVTDSIDISVTFNIDMDPATINDSTFVVNAMTTGLHTGTITYDAPSKTATFDPTEDFANGEIVTVMLTSGIESSGGIPLVDYAWSFTIAVDDGTGIFTPDVTYAAGGGPESVCSSDLDGDGDMDLATANNTSNNVSVLLNNGDGTFAAHTTYTAGGFPESVCASDLDGDGDIDLATANAGSNNVSVLMNDGDGTFAPQTTYFAGVGLSSVFASDLDGDGDMDLATANTVAWNLSVLMNNGDGTFAAPAIYSTGNSPRSVFASDLDGDGDMDLATANSGLNTVSVLMNNGDGTFAAAVTYPVTGTEPYSVFSADLDGDGDMDLATANRGSSSISVLINDGNGAFAPLGTYPVGNYPRSIFASDLDGDGDLDLATANTDSNNVSVLMNNGNGAFGAHGTFIVGSEPYSIFASDLDGDGDMDLATANRNSGNVSVLLNLDQPLILSTSPAQNQLNVSESADLLVTFDIDMDAETINDSTFVVNAMSTGLHGGVITYDSLTKTTIFDPVEDFQEGEVVTAVLTAGIQSSDGAPLVDYAWSFTIAVDDGSGSFAAQATYAAGNLPISVFASDLDGDGDIDLAVANLYSDNVSVLLNNGNGTFADSVNYAVGDGPFFVFSSDLDGDGDLDLATANYGSYPYYFGTASVLLNNGDGTFAAQVTYAAGIESRSVFASDLDGDGDMDLATANSYSNNVSVFMNNGDGTFAAQATYAAGDGPNSIFACDLDGDGDMDLVTVNFDSDNISVLLNNGDGSFAAQATYAAGNGPFSVFAADLDGDGDIDLVTTNINSDNVSVLLNNGDATFADQVNYAVGDYPRSVFSSDLDGDGDLDLATANSNSNNVSVFMNNGDGTFADSVNYTAGNDPASVFAADLDGDGDLDLASANGNYDNILVLLNVDSPGSVAGTVTDGAMDPVEGVYVSALGTTREDTTDIYGMYTLDSLEAGLYDISFSHIYYRDTVVTGVEVTAGDTTILDVRMEELPGLLCGTVTDEGSQPIESVYVEINTVTISLAESDDKNTGKTGKLVIEDKSDGGLLLEVVDSVYTDENGYYECELAAGSYDVLFSHDDYNDTTCTGVSLTPGDTTILDVQLVSAGCDYVTGDVNGSDSYNGLDITYGVNFFKGGSDPMCSYGSCPIPPCDAFFYCGDVNGSCNYNGLDVTYGVAYFKGGPDPIPCADCPPVE